MLIDEAFCPHVFFTLGVRLTKIILSRMFIAKIARRRENEELCTSHKCSIQQVTIVRISSVRSRLMAILNSKKEKV